MTQRFIVQAIFQGHSNLSKDRFVNVFHFNRSTIGPSDLAIAKLCCEKLADFYSTGPGSIDEYLSPTIEGLGTFKVYDEDAVSPRPVLYQGTWAVNPGPGAQPIPDEVALCLSYYTDRNIVGHRGRVYLGPLCTNATSVVGGNQSRPAADFLSTIAACASRLAFDHVGYIYPPVTDVSPSGVGAAANGATWCLRSRVGVRGGPVEYTTIQAGWIDNEWDAQRRRRIEATARVPFVAATA